MRSLRARLFWAIALAVLLSVGVTLGVGAVLTRRSIERALLANLSRQADLLAERERATPLTPPQADSLRAFLAREGIRFLLVEPSTPVPAQPGPVAGDLRALIARGSSGDGTTSFGGLTILYAIRPAGQGTIVLFRPANLGAADWRPYVGGFLLAGLLGAALAALGSFLLARAISRPVRRVAAAAQDLAAGRPPAPLPVEGSDELATLAGSFNEMAAQLARAGEAERSFLLSVSHELKTPLTAIRGYAEGLEEGAVRPGDAGPVIGREAARLERLVQDLLDLARINQRSFAVRREAIDLAEVARDAARRHEPRSGEFAVALSVDAPHPAPAVGDADRALQVVSNLVENALRCTPAGGAVTVSARPGEVSVRDTGPGLAAEDLDRAFERFFLYRRYGGERPVGSGLGLAIVKELTQTMGGSVTVESDPGHGTTFTVHLPRTG